MSDEVEFEVALPRSPSAPGLARHALRADCAGRVEPDVLADAELLVSELAANAIAHGHGTITLRAHLDEHRLRAEVIDEGGGFERELRGRSEARQVGGWGLGIVDDVASRWGVREGTTHVWFELERSGPRLGDADD